ncbi:Pfam:DUF88 [Seminavis robusta]|uniref:Meiosis regulator and mRNA stability factor 1 n=1 Tax=Seminavis robusta TaxID=568900 RepID=A0A9N8HEE8_9STRA|nr:Pfam:DUF88 [Seminavis robusta]|eukprot:Sro384_g131440.1 Pfam:DUF88 (440) ;mRNA; r:24162-25650
MDVAPATPSATARRQQPATPATASNSDLIDFPTLGTADVAIFWDFENVRIPAWCPTTTASEGIRNKVAKYGRIVEKRLYYDSRQPTEYTAPRAELDLSGFTLVDCPTRNRKETLDKKLIVDVLCFAWERASRGAKACVVLITSDGDYSYALARLRDIGVFTVIIYRPDIVAKVLIDNANVVMSWEYDVLGGPPQASEEDDHETTGTQDKVPSVVRKLTYYDPGSSADDGENQSSSSGPIVAKQPNVQTRGKFALFFSVVLDGQHRNVKEGISVYSSWAEEANIASTFYSKVGEKDRDAYIHIRNMATRQNFVEWGRRNLTAIGKPVIKVKDRDEKAETLSLETYLRLTYSGLAVLKPNVAATANDWTLVLTKTNKQKAENDGLRSYFVQFGPLDKVAVMEGRGFGFVFFRNHNDAEIVLKNAGHHFVDKKSIDVKQYQR